MHQALLCFCQQLLNTAPPQVCVWLNKRMSPLDFHYLSCTSCAKQLQCISSIESYTKSRTVANATDPHPGIKMNTANLENPIYACFQLVGLYTAKKHNNNHLCPKRVPVCVANKGIACLTSWVFAYRELDQEKN